MPVAPDLNRHPPLLEVTPFDHRAWLAVATALGLCCALMTLLIRIFVRALISPPFAHDDTINLAATIFATIQSAVVLHGVQKGLGMSVDLISPSNMLMVEKAAYASDILYLFSVYLSKCSVIFLLFRLSSKRRHQIAFSSTLAVSTVWVVASILAIALRCDLSQPWVILNEKCTSLLLRWQIVVAFDVATEIMIFAMSYYLIHGLHMALENKFTVVGAFGFRLLIIPFLIVRIISFPRHHLSTDPAFTLTYFYIWTQTTLYISLMTSMIPCLRPLMAGLNTAYGAFDTEHVTSQAYGSHISNLQHANSKSRRTNSRRTKRSSTLPSKSVLSSVTKGRNSILTTGTADKEKEKQAKTAEKAVAVVTPPNNTIAPHHGRQSPSPATIMDAELGLNPEVAAQNNEAGGQANKASNHSEAVAQDGNSIGSNDSQQMIIRKDISWAVEYSDP